MGCSVYIDVFYLLRNSYSRYSLLDIEPAYRVLKIR